ncbi:hypothetical protein [Streptomyces sp. MST-110588]|uniref:hypothetical protein n=1 Tax=Streptomyces sp. MST-110588 TaxID=2833628 RepID=UPI001F5E046B|nr:hypothetical protein [Streptomyces sp. MST-110588]UNO39617.1 hypothetical protein KGS77_08370 [Streptomyces sp. MST-110588]
MRRRISTLAVTAAMAGGVLFTALPAHAAPTAGQAVMAARGGAVTVDIREMQKQVAELRARADRQDRAGNHAGAKRTRAQADALQRRIQQFIDAENNMG